MLRDFRLRLSSTLRRRIARALWSADDEATARRPVANPETQWPLVGSHYLLELYDCPAELLDSPQHVADTLVEASSVARSTVLSRSVHRFQPHGVTGVALLAESHLTIHTWPELGYAALDLFTCGVHTRPREACEFLARAMGAGTHDLRELARGRMPTAPRPDASRREAGLRRPHIET